MWLFTKLYIWPSPICQLAADLELELTDLTNLTDPTDLDLELTDQVLTDLTDLDLELTDLTDLDQKLVRSASRSR